MWEARKKRQRVKIEKNVKKTVKIALIFLAIGILITSLVFYAFAPTPSSTFYISSGVYPGAPSYTVWREGNNYFAKDSNGQIVCSGTNASATIQYTFDNLANGGIVFIKEGIYLIDSPMTCTQHAVTITGVPGWVKSPYDKGTVLKANGVSIPYILKVSGFMSQVMYVGFNGDLYNATVGLALSSQDGRLTGSSVYKCHIGLNLTGNINRWICGNWIEYNYYGIIAEDLKYLWVKDNILANYNMDILLTGYSRKIFLTNNKVEDSNRFVKANGTNGLIEDMVSMGNILTEQKVTSYVFDCNASYVRIISDICEGGGVTDYFLSTKSGVKITECLVAFCDFREMDQEPFDEQGQKFKKQFNQGWRTESYGIAVILNTESSVVVTHNLHDSPTRISVTGTHTEVDRLYVTSINSVNFTITAGAGAVSGDRDVYWIAEVRD